MQEHHPTERSCPRPRSLSTPSIRSHSFHGRRNLHRSNCLCQAEQRKTSRCSASRPTSTPSLRPSWRKPKIEFRSGSHNDYVMRVGYKLAERRFSKKVALRWAMQKFGKDYPDTEQVINSCFANASPHGKQGGGGDSRGDSKTATVEEIKSFLDGHISLRFNEITSRVECKAPTDNTDARHRFMPYQRPHRQLPYESEMSTITRVNIQDMYRVIESDYVPLFNPFKEYLHTSIRGIRETVCQTKVHLWEKKIISVS